MTIQQWQIYFKVMLTAWLLPAVEYVVFQSAWTFIPVSLAIAWPVLTLRCMSCGLPVHDHRIATHFRGVEQMKTCPHCNKPMVPQK